MLESIKRYLKWKERQDRESDEDYIAKQIIRYCISRNCVGLSTPQLDYIVKFSIEKRK